MIAFYLIEFADVEKIANSMNVECQNQALVHLLNANEWCTHEIANNTQYT